MNGLGNRQKPFPKKIVLTGPESTAKTTLARMLAAHFGTTWVPEYARTYISTLDRSYTQNDLLQIAKQQIALEEKYLSSRSTNKLLFCDTALLVIKIWSEQVFGSCDQWIIDQLNRRSYDAYLLLYPDIEWEYDPLRESPDAKERMRLFHLYEGELKAMNATYRIIKGMEEEREINALQSVKDLL